MVAFPLSRAAIKLLVVQMEYCEMLKTLNSQCTHSGLYCALGDVCNGLFLL